ncbi:deoxyribonuclease-1 [Maylandia zebra]|uniref:Deoxyribonuclease n=3 Tax=Haplochromini TaxID=319058 RepID=A0A3P9DGI0_9CICH|nr:deoxyribonuclease-1 isoform X2 [Maylandia zebra]XP_024655888.1 deoxyribonuclease-1 isoform X2 [Maylandia zebra]XP_024655902.1 deoxyribonuclease-1 [Maylandia zebra]XP_026016372.1 deoxyribonuclease-1 isoform X2 [Astatotilapia calliptera]XP_026019555.1 deoxyribonuclease-1 isoform X2 [Astatotilapia calliptera]XP_026021939.1 deoxyribonuclease-1 isoform X2 [Astatotilapia calliptera]XP_026021942.1 deoxyribonuclease-1 isoform X2 [Astatotilapia calliptera]XP_026021944.1 deoxyribonuclease-1 isoform
MHLVGTLGLFLTLLHLSNSLLLGAFNIKSFGDTKASNTTLMNIITKIVQRYDVILIQEVRDSDLSATQKLMEYVNKDSPQYKYIVSEPLGASTYKERYLFLYREALVSVAKSYTYDDGPEETGQDAFSREPFVVMFSSKHTAVRDFTLIPQHTSPESAVRELNALYDVVADVRARWNNDDIVLLGDFNAGCSYVSGSDWQQIRIFTDKTFHWLITDAADTTVSQTVCPYDRIVVTADMMRGVVKDSAKVYNYMTDLNLKQDLALAVSDHFPVEVKLSG